MKITTWSVSKIHKVKYKLRAEQHGPLKNMAVAGGFFFHISWKVCCSRPEKKSDGRPRCYMQVKKNVYLLRTNRALVMDWLTLFTHRFCEKNCTIKLVMQFSTDIVSLLALYFPRNPIPDLGKCMLILHVNKLHHFSLRDLWWCLKNIRGN